MQTVTINHTVYLIFEKRIYSTFIFIYYNSLYITILKNMCHSVNLYIIHNIHTRAITGRGNINCVFASH